MGDNLDPTAVEAACEAHDPLGWKHDHLPYPQRLLIESRIKRMTAALLAYEAVQRERASIAAAMQPQITLVEKATKIVLSHYKGPIDAAMAEERLMGLLHSTLRPGDRLPGGLVCVPNMNEPNFDGFDVWRKAVLAGATALRDCGGETNWQRSKAVVEAAWSAMLAALAPLPPTKETET